MRSQPSPSQPGAGTPPPPCPELLWAGDDAKSSLSKKPLPISSTSCWTPDRWREWCVSRGHQGRSLASVSNARQHDGEKPSHHHLYPPTLFNQNLVLSSCCSLFLLLIGDMTLHHSLSQGGRRDRCASSRKRKKKDLTGISFCK